jgi:hypothetical protein
VRSQSKEEKNVSKLQKVLSEVAAAAGVIPKLGHNTAQNYAFVRAEDVLTAVREGLSSRGAAVTRSDMVLLESAFRESNNGKSKRHVTVRVELRVSLGDEHADFVGLGEGVDSGDKAIAKATTMAAKYAWAEAFQLSFGDDPEADESTDKDTRAPARTTKPAQQKEAPKKAVKVNVKATLKAIEAATTSEELDALRDDKVLYLRETKPEDFEALKQAIVARRAALAAEGAK